MDDRKKSGRASRKRKTPSKNLPKKDLRSELHQKLKEKRLNRTSLFSIETRMEKIEDRLSNAKTSKEREKLKKELELLEKAEETQLNQINNDHAEYSESVDYGGGMVRND